MTGDYIALFYTHSGAIRFDRLLKKKNVKSETMPVPRKLSSNCGIGVKFSIDGNVNNLISEDIERIYRIESGNYILIYADEPG